MASRRNPSGVNATRIATAPTIHQRHRTAQSPKRPNRFSAVLDARSFLRRGKTHFGGVSASSAGITDNDQNRQKITPMAVKMPNAYTGASGEKANETKPTAVVSDVLTTGQTISSAVHCTSSRCGRFGSCRRKEK